MLAPGVQATTIEISLARAGVGVNGRAWSKQKNRGEPGARAGELLPLLEQFIGKLALSSPEIAPLPGELFSCTARTGLAGTLPRKAPDGPRWNGSTFGFTRQALTIAGSFVS